jgi:hypothetical protein
MTSGAALLGREVPGGTTIQVSLGWVSQEEVPPPHDSSRFMVTAARPRAGRRAQERPPAWRAHLGDAAMSISDAGEREARSFSSERR